MKVTAGKYGIVSFLIALIFPARSYSNHLSKEARSKYQTKVGWCVSGQVGRFVFHEQVDFSKLMDVKKTLIDAYIILEDNNSSSLIASHGSMVPIPYLSEARDPKAVARYYQARGADKVLHKLIDKEYVNEYLEKISKQLVVKIGPTAHAITHEPKANRFKKAGHMFYLRYLAFAVASVSDDYSYFIITREDNVFLSPFNSITQLLSKLKDSSQVVSSDLADKNNSGSGGQVAVDMHCDGWCAYSDKIYATDLKGGSAIFGTTTKDFERFMELWVRHGIRCLKQIHGFYPQQDLNQEQYTYMLYLEKNGVSRFQSKRRKRSKKKRKLLQEAEELKQKSPEMDMDFNLDFNSKLYEKHNIYDQFRDQLWEPLEVSGQYHVVDDNDTTTPTMDSSIRNVDHRRLKNCRWVAHRREFLCEEESKKIIDEKGHVWSSGSLIQNQNQNQNNLILQKAPTVELQSKNNAVLNNPTLVLTNGQGGKPNSRPVQPSKNPPPPHPSVPASSVMSKSEYEPAKTGWKPIPWQALQQHQQAGHLPTKPGESRCFRGDVLQPESFLQDLMTARHVQIHPVDFMRTEVRFVRDKERPCVDPLYYACSPLLEKTHAFTKCSAR